MRINNRGDFELEQVLSQRRETNGFKDQKSTLIICDICHEPIKYRASYYDSGVNFGVICDICYKRFPDADIQLMRNLFNAYGGYFGKYKKLKASVYKRIKELLNVSDGTNSFSSANQINLQLLHAALLFGFTPKEYFQGLTSLG